MAQKITPCLWFDTQAEEAAKFYTSIFDDSRILETTHYGANAQMPEGTVLAVTFQLEGQRFMALNGGPVFDFTPAISLYVDCQTQQEVDEKWASLCAGGEEGQCGWLTDRYGVSWQIVPTSMLKYLYSEDSQAAQRAWQVMLQMKKIDMAAIEKAYSGE